MIFFLKVVSGIVLRVLVKGRLQIELRADTCCLRAKSGKIKIVKWVTRTSSPEFPGRREQKTTREV